MHPGLSSSLIPPDTASHPTPRGPTPSAIALREAPRCPTAHHQRMQLAERYGCAYHGARSDTGLEPAHADSEASPDAG